MKADISGSTPLAERLDPEDLRVVLGSYFAALAREIQRQRGFIDKYIGDAVLAIFGVPEARGDDAERAVRAGIAMQEAIQRENDSLEQRYGVRLACRIGINTGDVVAGPLTDDPNSSFTVIGEAVHVAERMESAAPLNSVLVSATTREAARGAFRFEPVAPVTMKGKAEALAAYRVVGLTRRGEARRQLPTDVAAAAAPGTSASLQVGGQKAYVLAEERKVVTVLFADISSSEPLGTKLEPTELRGVLGAYFGVLGRQIQRFGGTIDKYVGDAVMAVFGAPISHEDDAARAIGAALAIQQASRPLSAAIERDHRLQISIRIGINTGEVVAGLLPGEVEAYTVTGDAVNTAQRIESVAPPHEVLVSESTYRLARNAFRYESVPPLTLKGKSQPVPAYRVLGRERRASARGGTALVGRERDLDRLFDLTRIAATGTGQRAHVHGEAGVGKTRLLSEFLAQLATGYTRMRARASSYEAATPYALVADLVRRAFALQGNEPEADARTMLDSRMTATDASSESATILFLEILGYAVQSPLDPEAKRRLLVSLLKSIARERAAAATLVLVIEDVHWVDPASAAALADVFDDIETLRALVVTTSRDATALWPAVEVALGPLDHDGANAMIDTVAAAPLDPKVRALVLERTAGNPFFIEEVVHALAEGSTATVPATVQELLEARLDALDASPRRVAQGASVIGRSFLTRVLARVVPDEPLDPALDALEQVRFVGPLGRERERTYAFRHALVQEVVYKTQLVVQRRKMHGAVGDAIEDLFRERTDEFVDALAFHYDRSDLDAKALVWLVRAADRAKSLFANAEALQYYASALRRSHDGEGHLDAGTILEHIGEVQSLTGKYDDAIASFGVARARIPAPRPTTAARLYRRIGAALRVKGDYPAAAHALEEALAALGGADDTEAAQISVETGQLHYRAGDRQRGRDAFARALDHASAVEAQDLLAQALKWLAVVALDEGDTPGALELFERSRDAYQRANDMIGLAELYNNLGAAYRRIAQPTQALESYAQTLSLAERTGNLYALAMAHNNIGAVHVTRGAPAEGIPAYERAVEVLSAIGAQADVGLAQMNLGEAILESGDVAGARDALAKAKERLTAAGRAGFLPALYNYIARADLAAGDLAAASESAERSLELARAQGRRRLEALAQRVLAEIALARGDRETARALLVESRDMLSAVGELSEVARTEAVLQKLGA